ncbi:MAG: 23S rRNA (guanosine(2251)-2'-O)-methyltransferase RlmB [Elusimicrobia bacterium RIFCSPLOWO2_01_FULL_60_11]|nr:MAG: 23S rRNA (guanosine(2251)-2'-O)-methyltransferase RlmB [Elusimicrobia bacterium RIFCSPLOWO2_01_FULL_60_11]
MRREREKVYIYGKHALAEALQYAPQVLRKVFLSSEMAGDKDLRGLLKSRQIPTEVMEKKTASRMVGQDTSHQGVIAITDTSALVRDFKDFLADLAPSEDTMLVIMDELNDPHNVGAVIRSAAAFGAAGVLMPTHNQAPITGAVVKSSAGMAFRVPLVSIGNVNYAIEALQKAGFKAYALVMKGSKSISKIVFDAPAVFIVGNEGAGIHKQTIANCDEILRIPMNPRCESLNASVSAAVVLYQWSTQHLNVLKGQ